MRLFVAVDVPQPEKQRVLAATHALRTADLPVRWVDPAGFHLTLKFLGEVPAALAPQVHTAVGDVAARHSPFVLRVTGAGAFPSPRRPAVLWLGVERSEPLHALQQDVERTIAPLGFPTEARPFSPHLTLGRVPRGTKLDIEAKLGGIEYDAQFTIRTLDLMQSHLSPRGARYERLLAAELSA